MASAFWLSNVCVFYATVYIIWNETCCVFDGIFIKKPLIYGLKACFSKVSISRGKFLIKYFFDIWLKWVYKTGICEINQNLKKILSNFY